MRYINYSETMRILLLIMGLLATPAVSADVYRSVDDSGNIVYSDKPSPDAEKIQIDEIQTIEAPDIGPFEYTPPKNPAGTPIYTKLEITSPEEGAAIRSNSGEITISSVLEPGLNTASGHQLVLIMDGNDVATGGPQFNLQNVDRGTHSVSVAIKDSSGKVVMQSTPVTFTLQRIAVQPPPPPPKPAPPPKPPI